MKPVVIPLPNDTAGDTWKGVTIGPVLINGSQPSHPLVSCSLCFYRQTDNVLAYAFRNVPGSGEGTITITNANTWLVNIPVQVCPLTPGKYNWFFVAVDSLGNRDTYYTGVIEIGIGSNNG